VITGIPAMVLNMITIMALGVLLSVIVISFYVKFSAQKQRRYAAKTYQKILWILVLMPWLMGLTAAISLIFFGAELNSLQNIIGAVHWHHVDEFNMMSWHGVLVLVVVFVFAYFVIKSVKELFNNIQKINVLKSMAHLNSDNIFLLDTDSPLAFVGGFLKPQVYLTTGMKKSLRPEELEIVLLHEREHLRNKDPLKKLLFKWLSSFFHSNIANKLQSAMNLTIEQRADQAVTSRFIDKSKIEETLLKIKSLSVGTQASRIPINAVCHYGFGEVEHRIRYLLLPEPDKAFPVLSIVMIVPILKFSCTYFAASAHHLIEHILS